MVASGAQPDSGGVPIDWRVELARHEHWLRAVLVARLRDRHAVAEVMQEVSLAAVEQKAPLDDPVRLPAWLYRLAVRQALLYRRRLGRERRRLQRYAEGNPQSNGRAAEPDPLGWLLSRERAELVRQALGRLAARDRELLLLKYAEDWSYHEMATHLGLSHSAVESRLHRARQRMREQMTRMKVVDDEI